MSSIFVNRDLNTRFVSLCDSEEYRKIVSEKYESCFNSIGLYFPSNKNSLIYKDIIKRQYFLSFYFYIHSLIFTIINANNQKFYPHFRSFEPSKNAIPEIEKTRKWVMNKRLYEHLLCSFLCLYQYLEKGYYVDKNWLLGMLDKESIQNQLDENKLLLRLMVFLLYKSINGE